MKRKLTVVGLAVIALLMVVPCVSMAQPGRGGGRGFGGFGGGQSSLQLLGVEAVANELALVDEQKEQLQDLGESFRDEMRNVFQNSRDMSREERGDLLRDKMEEMQGKVNGILTPQQQNRIKQISFQMQMRRGGTASDRSIETIARELELSDDEKEKLLARAEEVRKNLQEKIAEANQSAMDELMESLSSDQREKLKELSGEMFDVPPQQLFGGRGDRGGQGRRGLGGGGRRGGGENNQDGEN